MKKPKVYIVNGLGIGCHEEVAHAFEQTGADAEIIHIRRLFSGDRNIFSSQIIDLSGGFLHGDILNAGMPAANELEHSGIKDRLLEFAERGNIIYGQCNGFQLLVKTGLLPGIDNDYSKQTVTLTGNIGGNYRVDFVQHQVDTSHFAFHQCPEVMPLWVRHGEGRIVFHSKYGLISEEEGEENRRRVNERHVLMRCVNPDTFEATEEFPYNPNGSVDGIAGLVNENGNIFGHMAHPEVSIYLSRDPRFADMQDFYRRNPDEEKPIHGVGFQIFKNIVGHVKES